MKKIFVIKDMTVESQDEDLGLISWMMTLALKEPVEMIDSSYLDIPDGFDRRMSDLWCIGVDIQTIAGCDMAVVDQWKMNTEDRLVRMLLSFGIHVVDINWMFQQVSELYLKRGKAVADNNEPQVTAYL